MPCITDHNIVTLRGLCWVLGLTVIVLCTENNGLRGTDSSVLFAFYPKRSLSCKTQQIHQEDTKSIRSNQINNVTHSVEKKKKQHLEKKKN